VCNNSSAKLCKKSNRKSKNNPTSSSPYSSTSEIIDDHYALTNLSLFRRISFAPDGSHLCATNATLQNKNIAAMIGRDCGDGHGHGWAVSGPNSSNNNRNNDG